MNKSTVWLIGFLILIGCSKQKPATGTFAEGKVKGVASKRIEEASGLVASHKNPGYLWTINDSGNLPEIYLLNEKAEIVMTCNLKQVMNRDWEEIFIGPGPKENTPYLYVADIGDNSAQYLYKILYRLEEPLFSKDKMEITEIDTIVFTLSDNIRDTETMLFDSLSNSFFILSKREPKIKLYELKYPFLNDTLVAQEKTELPFYNIVAADICPQGDELLVKDYDHVYYWKREKDESFMGMVQRKPIELNYDPEPQGESIAWRHDDSGYFTLSEAPEHKKSALLFYSRNKN